MDEKNNRPTPGMKGMPTATAFWQFTMVMVGKAG
jgi:hypothetical protein